MGLNDVLVAISREAKSSNHARRLRRDGLMPAIIYGSKKEESKSICVEYNVFKKAYLDNKSNNNLYTLKFENETNAVLLKDMQIDPLKRTVIHADFYKIDLNETLKVKVPVVLSGKPVGVDKGGVLQQNMLDVEVEGKPEKIPPVLLVDVSDLEFGKSLNILDVKVEEGLTLVCASDESIASVVVPKGLEDLAEEETGTEEASVTEAAAE